MSVPLSLISADAIRVNNLDPTTITNENKFILESLFSDNHVNEFMDTGNHVLMVWDALSNKNVLYQVTFKYPVIIRRDFYGRVVVDVVGSVIGEGSFGSAKVILGTLKHRLGELCFEKETRWRVIKTGNRKHHKLDTKYIDGARKEFDLTAACAHTSARGLFCTKPKTRKDILEYAFSMRMFAGCDLFEILEADLDKKEELSVVDRFKLTMAILEQLEYQVHQNGIVHRDIKPENIIVIKTGNRWEANYIDFNLSRWSDVNDGKAVGTLSYISPDALTSCLDEKSDLYSLMLIIALLWRDAEQLRIDGLEDPIPERIDNNWIIKLDLFHDIDGIPENIKVRIQKFISKCTSLSKEDRPNMTDAIHEFSDIYLAYKLSTIPVQFHAEVKSAHEIGYQARYKMRGMSEKGIDPDAVMTLSQNLLKMMGNLPASEYAVREFSECSGIGEFANVKTQKMIVDKINKAVKVFTDEYQFLHQQCDKLYEMYTDIVSKKSITSEETDCIKILLEQILYAEKIPEKLAHKPLNVDEIIDQAARLIYRNQKISRAITEVEKRLPKVEGDSAVRSLLNSMCR